MDEEWKSYGKKSGELKNETIAPTAERKPSSRYLLETASEVAAFADFVRNEVWKRLVPVMSTPVEQKTKSDNIERSYPPLFQDLNCSLREIKNSLESIQEVIL
jgi:hypothetical protein